MDNFLYTLYIYDFKMVVQTKIWVNLWILFSCLSNQNIRLDFTSIYNGIKDKIYPLALTKNQEKYLNNGFQTSDKRESRRVISKRKGENEVKSMIILA